MQLLQFKASCQAISLMQLRLSFVFCLTLPLLLAIGGCTDKRYRPAMYAPMVSRIMGIRFEKSLESSNNKLIVNWHEYAKGFSNPPQSLINEEVKTAYLAVELPSDMLTTSFYNTAGTMIFDDISAAPSAAIKISNCQINGIYAVTEFIERASDPELIAITAYEYRAFHKKLSYKLTPCDYYLRHSEMRADYYRNGPLMRVEVNCEGDAEKYNFLLLPTKMYHFDADWNFPCYEEELTCWYVIDLRLRGSK